jgi:hypothetical protein
METSSKSNMSDHTLLMVISSKMDTLMSEIKEIKDEMKTKVHMEDFRELRNSFEDHKKETNEKINSHAVKIGVGAALLTAGSWLISLLK